MGTATMHVVRLHAIGGPEHLVHEEVARPEPGPGEVLERVYAAGVNPPDLYARRGFDNVPAALRPAWTRPFVLGSEVSGVVAPLGPGAGSTSPAADRPTPSTWVGVQYVQDPAQDLASGTGRRPG
ncbi:hypothetical protein GCM10010377_73530 [Streptomyces viridiviolaceus]|nr:hypothetical protein GCM10010377_73530 [Streptomyces viridiviolaceus]